MAARLVAMAAGGNLRAIRLVCELEDKAKLEDLQARMKRLENGL